MESSVSVLEEYIHPSSEKLSVIKQKYMNWKPNIKNYKFCRENVSFVCVSVFGIFVLFVFI